MTTLHLPWLEASILVLLGGAAWVSRLRTAEAKSSTCLWISAIAFALTVAAWVDYVALMQETAQGPVASWLELESILIIDSLAAPLLPLASILYLFTFAGTLKTKFRQFSFPGALIAEAILLAIFACRAGWPLAVLLMFRLVPPYLEMRSRDKPTGAYVFHLLAFAILLVGGYALVKSQTQLPASGWIVAPLTIAVLIRGGIAPFHCWAPDLFEHATFGTALLFLTPMVGAYSAARFVLPIATIDTLHALGLIALVSALYAAGMAMIQREARRFFCYLLLSHSALVFVGLMSGFEVCLTGGLCIWLSIGLSLGGLGLTLRALEARHGRLSLVRFQGLYDHTPALAVCFLLTGLASVGFPYTFGYIGTEMLVDGAIHAYPYVVGAIVVMVAALNGIAVVQAYFKIFTGSQHVSTIHLGIGIRERWTVLSLAALIFAGGLFPQSGVASRFHAAQELLKPQQTHPASPRSANLSPVRHVSRRSDG
ncbi:MAG: oxidoreductase [Pirellulales bacterium]|nr:oxidoreductase [Pirellulales bacterium]